jgi:hypothetical protein
VPPVLKRVLIAVAVIAVLVIASHLGLRFFRFS